MGGGGVGSEVGLVSVKVHWGDSIKTHKHMEVVSISAGAGSSRLARLSVLVLFLIFCP